MPIIALILAALQAEQSAQTNKQQTKLSAAQTQFSPWTGQKGAVVAPAQPVNQLAQGVGSFLAMKQQGVQQQQTQAMQDAYTNYLNSQSGNGPSSYNGAPALGGFAPTMPGADTGLGASPWMNAGPSAVGSAGGLGSMEQVGN